MFKKRIIIDSDIEISRQVSDLKDGEAIQLLEKGQSDKVVITMEQYFTLIAKSEKNTEKRTNYNPKDMVSKIVEKEKKIREAFKEHELVKKEGVSSF